MTIVEVLGFCFEWQKKLSELGWWPTWAPAANSVIYVTVTVMFFRAIFLLAERTGELEEQLGLKMQDFANCVSDQTERTASFFEYVSSVHCIIHQTRDELFSTASFLELLSLDKDQAAKRLYSVIEMQLGIIQGGLRALTNSDCNVCLKIIRSGALEHGTQPGFFTVCYGPAVAIERRQNSAVLPLNQGIASEAIITKRIAWSNDITTDDRFWPRERRGEYAKTYRTVVASPVIMDGKAQGVLCFDWKKPNMYREEFHRHAIAAFTDIVSTACYIVDRAHILVENHTPKTEEK